jgi:hydrogenase maturation protease
LWPYRRSARKNQQRWTFGGVYPPAFSDATDPCRIQTQCLVVGREPEVEVRVRFLQVVERRPARREPDGSLTWLDELRVGEERVLAWDEAREREVVLTRTTPRQPIDVPAGEEEEPVPGGAIVRGWHALHGMVELEVEQLRPDLRRLTVKVENLSPWQGRDRAAALRHTFASTHTILRVADGEFVSLMDPPAELKPFADACQNVKTWPVLVGDDGQRDTLLSSPIILYDYPQVAPESRGDLFDAGEIDQLLALNILTLTDAEKAEMRATDPRVRRILERTEAFTPEDFMSLHGTIRDLQVLERPVPRWLTVQGVRLTAGSRVRLRPRAGRDIFDLALAGKIAVVESIEQDYDERIHLAVTVEDDPGRDLGAGRMIGHRFFFAPEEVEPLL